MQYLLEFFKELSEIKIPGDNTEREIFIGPKIFTYF